MEIWKNIWRKGIAPLLSSSSLVALQRALEESDPIWPKVVWFFQGRFPPAGIYLHWLLASLPTAAWKGKAFFRSSKFPLFMTA